MQFWETDCIHYLFGPSVEIRDTMESMRSSPHRASVHRTLAFNCSNLNTKEKS